VQDVGFTFDGVGHLQTPTSSDAIPQTTKPIAAVGTIHQPGGKSRISALLVDFERGQRAPQRRRVTGEAFHCFLSQSSLIRSFSASRASSG
jgi:hypothetical protein